jgi:hypothetical protein
MNDDSQYDLSNFRKKSNSESDSQYDLSNFIKKPKEEEQETTIGQDIKQSFLNSPHAMKEMLFNLPHEINEAAHMPLGRSLKNIGQGVENLATAPIDLGSQLVNYLAKKHVPYAEKLKEIYPEIPEHDLFGLGAQQPGDTLFQSAVPFGAIGKATKAIKGLKGIGTRSGFGAAYSAAQGENPIESFLTGSALEGLTHGSLGIPTNIKNLNQRMQSGISNAILNKTRKGIETGESFTPEQAARNALQQYTNIEGQPMGVDFGTLVGNKPIQDLYNVGKNIPLTGGRQQVAKVDKQLFDKKEALGKLTHEKEQGELSEKQQNYENQLRTSIEQLQKNKDILEKELPKSENEINEVTNAQKQQKAAINEAPNVLTSLRHPELNHNQLFKNEIETGFNDSKEMANEAYQPFNKLDVDLNKLRMPDTFNSRYKKAFDEFNQQSEDLKELFRDDRDLGNDISREINRAESFFETRNEKPSGAKNRIGTEPLVKLKKATPEAITTHIRNLQSLAEEAYASGKHRESAMLKRMASGLKDDMKEILSENGFHDAVNSLEEGDKIFKENVLPYYKNREIKKLASDPLHQLSDTSRISLSNDLHQPNMSSILDQLSPAAQNSTIYELITRGKYGREGHGLSPNEIATSFKTHLKSNVRESIANTNPDIAHYLENLSPMIKENAQLETNLKKLNKNKENLQKETNENISEHEEQKNKSEEGKNVTEQKLKESNERFQKLMNERFGIPKAKSKSIFAAISNFSPLKAAGLGTTLYAMGKFSLPHITEVLGLSVMPFKLSNKILTEIENGKPKLLTHYTEGTKVKPMIKNKSDLEQRIKQAFSMPKNVPLNEKNKRKPLEIEVEGKRR